MSAVPSVQAWPVVSAAALPGARSLPTPAPSAEPDSWEEEVVGCAATRTASPGTWELCWLLDLNRREGEKRER